MLSYSVIYFFVRFNMVKALVDKTKKPVTKVAVKQVSVKQAVKTEKTVKPIKVLKAVKVSDKKPKECSFTVPDLSVPMDLARAALATL